MTNLAESLSHIRLLIEKEAYEKDIEEPTPLEEKCRLVAEVKEMFLSDLHDLGISSITTDVAWSLAEDVEGADEALNKAFLYRVVNYVEILETYYYELKNSLIDNKLKEIFYKIAQ